MDFALYDLFTGSTTVHTRAGFVKAVVATTDPGVVKDGAIDFQDAVWGRQHIPRTVTQVGAGELEFTVRGGKLTAEVTIEPTTTVPGGLVTTQIALQQEIRSVENNFIGAGNYWVESFFFREHLRLGATAVADGNGVLTTVYGPDLTTAILSTPTH
jgi:hypothetical protein